MFGQLFVIGGVAGLVWRRAFEFCCLRRTLLRMRMRREECLACPPAEIEYPRLVVLLPLHREQLLAPQLIQYFRDPDYPRDRILVVFITTEKEPPADGPTTADVLRGLLGQDCPSHFLHLHYPEKHRFRADQMNFALRSVCPGWPAGQTYVGVYNADSQPDRDTFRLLAAHAVIERRRTGAMPAAYQQGVRYFVPARYRRTMVAHTVAALQSLYTCAHLLRRIDAARPGGGTPVTFAGHGEFIRLDVVKDVGMFPNYAYADGLLMGWEVAFAGNPITVLPAFDHCEVPQGIRATIRQHKAWFLGLLNLTAAVQHRFGGGLWSIRRKSLRRFVLSRMLATLGWGVRSAFLVVLLIAGAWTGRGWFLAAAAAVMIFAIAPLIYADVLWPELSTFAPGQRPSSALWQRLSAALPALFIDGCGFWPALAARLSARGAPRTPPSTER